MKFTATLALAGLAACAHAASDSESWSFASTIYVSDPPSTSTQWYTVSVPFETTVTQEVSGTTETITTTLASISMGTVPPQVTTEASTEATTSAIDDDNWSNNSTVIITDTETPLPWYTVKTPFLTTYTVTTSGTTEVFTDTMLSFSEGTKPPQTATTSTESVPTTLATSTV